MPPQIVVSFETEHSARAMVEIEAEKAAIIAIRLRGFTKLAYLICTSSLAAGFALEVAGLCGARQKSKIET